MNRGIATGCELSKRGQSNLRYAIRCMLLAAATCGAAYSITAAAQQSPLPVTLDPVVVTGHRPYVPPAITTLATVRVTAMNPNSVTYYVDGVRVGDPFLGSYDTGGYDNDHQPGPVEIKNPEPRCETLRDNPVDVVTGLKHASETDFLSVSNPDLKLYGSSEQRGLMQ